jgi:hypothetical protein
MPLKATLRGHATPVLLWARLTFPSLVFGLVHNDFSHFSMWFWMF